MTSFNKERSKNGSPDDISDNATETLRKRIKHSHTVTVQDPIGYGHHTYTLRKTRPMTSFGNFESKNYDYNFLSQQNQSKRYHNIRSMLKNISKAKEIDNLRKA